MPHYKVRITESWTRQRVVSVTAMNSLDAEYAALTQYAGPVDRESAEGAREVDFGRLADALGFIPELDPEVLGDDDAAD